MMAAVAVYALASLADFLASVHADDPATPEDWFRSFIEGLSWPLVVVLHGQAIYRRRRDRRHRARR